MEDNNTSSLDLKNEEENKIQNDIDKTDNTLEKQKSKKSNDELDDEVSDEGDTCDVEHYKKNSINDTNKNEFYDYNKEEIDIKCKDNVSKGFLSPPAFHITEIIHNEKCFKQTQGHVVVEVNGDICIFGGIDGNKLNNDFIRYIPGIRLFEKMRLSSNDINPRAYCSGNIITENNKKYMIIFGGINDNKEPIDETCKFDFQKKVWYVINNKINPCSRYKHASFSFENFVYIHGGLDYKDNVLSDFWCLENEMWKEVTQIEKIPEARYGHSLIFSFYGNARLVFLFGGNKKCFNGALSDTWIFNINTNRWREISKRTGCKPCARWGHSAQLFDNEWMIIYGGITNGWIDNYALSDIYALNIFTFSWFDVDLSTSKSLNRGYYGSLCLLPYKKSLHVFGGSDNSRVYSDVFSMSPIITYISYKALTGKIEQLNNKMKDLNAIPNDNENVDLTEFEVKISELKEEVNNINNMIKSFETKFYELEKLNEQCEIILSKEINSEYMEKLEERIKKLELSNNEIKD